MARAVAAGALQRKMPTGSRAMPHDICAQRYMRVPQRRYASDDDIAGILRTATAAAAMLRFRLRRHTLYLMFLSIIGIMLMSRAAPLRHADITQS